MSADKASVKPVKLCYSHIGGKLGSLLIDNFIEKGWIARDPDSNKHYYLTPAGEKGLTKMGIDISQIKS
ncbi:ArsR family transcriptional regulator [Chitinophaga vietnamensis]|uniref:ArsR family transcriptional regulator n=1 Tax=Chitinophaga vietnamensis TaxID=2593957 RepID=UPI0011789801|nr:ArsR family transcriptional regulator [Chitinophaga vietnamensis]